MATVRIATEQPDLAPVLGELGDASKLTAKLTVAGDELTGIIETLNERGENGFHSDGMALSREPTLLGWKPEIAVTVGGPPIQ